MIRSDVEYREALSRLAQEKQHLALQETRLKDMGLSSEEVARAMEPVSSFHLGISEEVATYEKLKRGELDAIRDLRELGKLLIGARIARGLTQRELAERLGVHESQVCRDERNEYHGVSVERAAAVLAALGIVLTIQMQVPGPHQRQSA